MITTNKYTVPFMMCNEELYLTMRNLCALMFEVSYDQAMVAEDGLNMENYRWIVYSRDISITEHPKYKDELEISTYTIGMNKFYAYRNFEVRKEAKVIVKAYCVFFLIDINRMRPIKISKEIMDTYGKEEPIFIADKHEYNDKFDTKKEIHTRLSDRDINYHINNTIYFDYIRDVTNIKDQEISYYNIVYKNEIRNKDIILGESADWNNETDFRLKSIDSDTIYTYGKIKKNV